MRQLDFIRQAFGSPGGKSRVAQKLVKLIPEHKTFCEVFAGGAAVFFVKEPSEIEVLNDSDSEIAFVYKFMKNLTENQIGDLKKLKWDSDKGYFDHLKKTKTASDINRFHKFIYLNRFSYGKMMKNYLNPKDPQHSSIVNRISELHERLKNSKIHCEDYLNVIKKYDSPTTFFFLDPPYPEEWPVEGAFSFDDLKKMEQVLKNIKGKFLLTLNILPQIKEMFKSFNIRKLKFPRTLQKQDNWSHHEYELLIANYDIRNIKFSELDFIRNVADYDPTKLTNEQLSDDWRIVMSWFSTFVKTNGKGIKYSREDIVNLAKIIFDEIVSRVKSGKMMHEFKPEEMKPTSKELYKIVSKGKEVPFAAQMNIKLLGTGPTDPIPREGCNCELCKEARKPGSKSKRTQSSILINNKLLVDCTPSIEEQMEKLNPKIEAILITHAHSDCIQGLKKVQQYLAKDTVSVYTLPHTIKLINKIIGEKDYLEFHEVKPYDAIKILDFSVTAYPVEHSVLQPKFDPTISWKINSIVYAEDIDEDFFLSDKSNKLKSVMKRAKVVLLDGALCKGKLKGHINIWHVISHLKNQGIDNVYFIQVGHSCPTYEELSRELKLYSPNFVVTYDGMEIKSPMSFAEMNHIYLVAHHAEMAWKDEKTLIIKAKNFPNMTRIPLILVDKNYAYGVIKMRPADEISKQQFEELELRHKITDEESKKRWGDTDSFYSYEFEWIERYKKPQTIKVPHGVQTFFGIDFTDSNVNKTLEYFKDMTIINRFISIAGGFIDKNGKEYNDIDCIIRMSPPNDFIRRAIESRFDKELPKEIADNIHAVFDAEGPHSKFIPLYDLVLRRIPKSELIQMAQKATLMQAYLPQKPYGSAYYKIEDIMEQIKEDVGYSVEFKYNGFHVSVHKKDTDVKIFSEQKKNLTVAFPTLTEEIKKLSPKDFIIDGELVPYDKEGNMLGRNVLMKYMGAVERGKEIDDSNIKLHVWDIIHYGN